MIKVVMKVERHVEGHDRAVGDVVLVPEILAGIMIENGEAEAHKPAKKSKPKDDLK